MGCASQRGKEDQHGCHVNVNQEKCVGCGTCVKICPRQAMSITDKKCHCDPTKCVGCFECMTVCPQEACEVDWATDLPALPSVSPNTPMAPSKASRGMLCTSTLS